MHRRKPDPTGRPTHLPARPGRTVAVRAGAGRSVERRQPCQVQPGLPHQSRPGRSSSEPLVRHRKAAGVRCRTDRPPCSRAAASTSCPGSAAARCACSAWCRFPGKARSAALRAAQVICMW